MEFYLQGLTVGLAYVAPIGLQNMFVINSALTHRFHRSIVTAIIVIFFDITLALGCFFGIGAVVKHYEWLQLAILLIGSLIVIYIGIGLLREKTKDIEEQRDESSIIKTITSACIVTWFNPQAIIDGTMMLGAFRVTLPTEQSTTFILGVATASALWFTGLTIIISIFSNKFNARVLRVINLVCGTVIIFYGIKLLYNFFSIVM